MTQFDVFNKLGITDVHEVSPTTTVIQFRKGGCRPASPLEVELLRLFA